MICSYFHNSRCTELEAVFQCIGPFDCLRHYCDVISNEMQLMRFKYWFWKMEFCLINKAALHSFLSTLCILIMRITFLQHNFKWFLNGFINFHIPNLLLLYFIIQGKLICFSIFAIIQYINNNKTHNLLLNYYIDYELLLVLQ